MTTNALGSLLSAVVFLAGCSGTGCGGERAGEPSASVAPTSPAAPVYDVHEWGLVRGTAADTVMVSGPHAEPPVMPVAKPVLYFHREGEGPLRVEVRVEVRHGRIVEHWPLIEGAADTPITWRGLGIEAGTCPGSRYPTELDPPCSSVVDGCEAAELATVETTDGDCVRTTDGTTWNHLFYRAEVRGAPALPLRFESVEDGRVRVTNTGTSPIVGRLLRLRHGANGLTEAALVADPPAPGESVTLDAPSAALADAAAALSTSLTAAGLTEAEAAAFRRAWDLPLFGSSALATTAGADLPAALTATPVAGASPSRGSWTATLYVLPTSTADSLATLRFAPTPRTVRRAIVAWIDEARAP